MKNLHEEDHWWDVLDKKGKDFVTKFGTKETIDKIIKNQGMLGKVLDIADRITYTMKDMYGIQTTFPFGEAQSNSYFIELNAIIAKNPNIGNIYKEVKIDQEKQDVFFSNADNLNIFLNLRAHLYKNLYMYPTNQARDLLIAKAIAQIYSKDGNSILSPDKLRKMSDYDLMKVLANHYEGYAAGMHPLLTDWDPEFEKFDSMDGAEKKEEELRQKNNIVAVGIKECRGFDPATEYKVADGNKHVEFRKYNSLEADKIERIVQVTKGIFLFWTDVSEDSQTNRLLKTILRKIN